MTQRYAPWLTLLPAPWTCVLSIDSANRPIASRSAPRQLCSNPGTAAAAARSAAAGMLARFVFGMVPGTTRQHVSAHGPCAEDAMVCGLLPAGLH